MKLSYKILIPFFAVVILACFGVGLWTRCSFTETTESTLFVLVTVFILIVLPAAWLCSSRPWLRNLRLHRPRPFSDPQLGQLRFSFGFTTCLWRGSITLLPGVNIPLAVAGTANGPEPEALAMARDLTIRLPSWRPSIEKALFEHYASYAEAVASGELKLSDPLAVISGTGDVWPFISWVYASIAPIGGTCVIVELGVTVPWDEEAYSGIAL